MSNNLDMLDKRNVFTDCEDKYACKIRRSEHNYRQVYEYDKKMKREIANCNERRRMQSINTGFETLKELLPMSIDGEKLSKASILQLTAKYIETLLTRLSTLEKEIASYKKSTSSKEKVQSTNKSSPSLHLQEQTRKRRLNSCTTDTITVTLTQQTNEAYLDNETTDNLGSLSIPGSESCEGPDKTPGSLEHLVAAIEQVEGERFYAGSGPLDKQLEKVSDGCGRPVKLEAECASVAVCPVTSVLNRTHSNYSSANSTVMKPTISPYTEKIIRAVSQHPNMFNADHPGHLFAADSRNSYRSVTSDDNFQFGVHSQPHHHRNHHLLASTYGDDVIRKNKTL